MGVKDILLVLTDQWADWEAAHAIAELNTEPERFVVKTAAADRTPKRSIGGLRAEIDLLVQEYEDFERLAMVILPGGFEWQEKEHPEIEALVRKARERHIPIAAICGATIFLGRKGFLNEVRHTGDQLEYFTSNPAYTGKKHFAQAQCVAEDGMITANETAAVEFCYRILCELGVGDEERRQEWREHFTWGMEWEE